MSRKLDFEDEDDQGAMMIPLDSPPPFDDDSTPDDDPFNTSNRPSSIGRVSDFPPIEIDSAETKKRGLNDSSIQMFRLLVRGVRARSARISIMCLTPTRISLSEVLEQQLTHLRQNHSHTNTELALEHRYVRVSWIRIPKPCFFKT